MYAVHPKKKESNKLVIKVDPYARRGKSVVGKSGIHKDKRKKAKVNERADWKKGI